MDGKYSAVFCRGVGFEPLRRALVLSREPMDPGYKEMKELEQDDYANVDESWKAEIDALRRICKNLNVDAVVERSRSGRGAHLWIFFKEMIPARLARQFGFALLEKGAESVNLTSFKYYDRMIPAQDALPEGGLGNVIALPLQGMALKNGNSAFVDENWNAYEDQLNVLAGTRRLTRQEIEDYLAWQ